MEKNVYNSKSPRKSNIELLRIIAMVMIVAHHLSVHSGFAFASNSISFNRLWIQFIQMGGKIGVDIFILISGYFLVTAKSVKINKVINLWLQIVTYSVGTFALVVIFSPETFGLKAFIKNLLPITFSKWWFASTYFVLYLISPYINKFLNFIDKKTYQRFLCLLLFFWCIIPTVSGRSWESSSLLWFIFLYALAGYVRLYIDVDLIKSGKCILAAVVLILLTFSSVLAFNVIGLKVPFVSANATFFYEMDKLPILIISLMLFLGFVNMKMGYIPFINVISATCFGIYLIHDNIDIRELLWCIIFKNANYQESSFLIIYTLLQIVVVFVACVLIELVRIHLIEKVYAKQVNKVSIFLNEKIEKLFSCSMFEKI